MQNPATKNAIFSAFFKVFKELSHQLHLIHQILDNPAICQDNPTLQQENIQLEQENQHLRQENSLLEQENPILMQQNQKEHIFRY